MKTRNFKIVMEMYDALCETIETTQDVGEFENNDAAVEFLVKRKYTFDAILDRWLGETKRYRYVIIDESDSTAIFDIHNFI